MVAVKKPSDMNRNKKERCAHQRLLAALQALGPTETTALKAFREAKVTSAVPELDRRCVIAKYLEKKGFNSPRVNYSGAHATWGGIRVHVSQNAVPVIGIVVTNFDSKSELQRDKYAFARRAKYQPQ